MATKKREIYARCAVQLRTHHRAFKAEALCPGAMGLYLFLLLDSRGELTDGNVLDVAAEASWGGKESYRKKQAEALIAVGLVERVGDQLHVVKYGEHNDTPDDVATRQAGDRLRKQKERSPKTVTRDITVTDSVCHGDVPISYSISPSGSDLQSRSDQPDRSGGPRWTQGVTALEARRVYSEAVAAATGRTYALAKAPFHATDLCDLLNEHGPDAPLSEGLEWLRAAISEWVAETDPTFAKGWAPGKLLDWLNAGRPKRRAPPASGAEVTKQPYDPDAPWMKVGA